MTIDLLAVAGNFPVFRLSVAGNFQFSAPEGSLLDRQRKRWDGTVPDSVGNRKAGMLPATEDSWHKHPAQVHAVH